MRIAYSLPDLFAMQRAMLRKPEDATYVLQVPIQEGLGKRNHTLTYIGQKNPGEVIFTDNIRQLEIAKATWTDSVVFKLAEKVFWHIQQSLRIPYLNVFSTMRLVDVCLNRLPGHDLVYERHSLYKTGVAGAAKRLGLPFVLFFEADDILESDYMGKPIQGLLRWRAKQMMQYNLKAADCVISVSEAGKNYLVDQLKVSPQKILVFPNGVDVDQFRPDQDVRIQVRSDLGWISNPIVIFVGNFYQWHDVATLLDAFVEVLSEIPECRLLLVGGGHKQELMERLAIELGISKVVKFTGRVPQSDVPLYMNAADVAVVPYPKLKQGMWFSPLKLYEYMATGKSVIATGIGQINEVIIDQRNGLLVPPEDSLVMANRIVALIKDEALRTQLGRCARGDAVQKYSWEKYISRLEGVFQAVYHNRPLHGL